MSNILDVSFFAREDTLAISRELLGKYLFTEFEGKLTGGMIVETEAYLGEGDSACHASNGRRTTRTEVMYGPPGVAYIYLCYGIHNLFNIVTHRSGHPHAILIRAIHPTIGLETMLGRRNKKKVDRSLTGGPGALGAALGLNRSHTGLLVTKTPVWVEDRKETVSPTGILSSPRVGVAYAGADALLPYRFRIASSKWTSPAK